MRAMIVSRHSLIRQPLLVVALLRDEIHSLGARLSAVRIRRGVIQLELESG